LLIIKIRKAIVEVGGGVEFRTCN